MSAKKLQEMKALKTVEEGTVVLLSYSIVNGDRKSVV